MPCGIALKRISWGFLPRLHRCHVSQLYPILVLMRTADLFIPSQMHAHRAAEPCVNETGTGGSSGCSPKSNTLHSGTLPICTFPSSLYAFGTAWRHTLKVSGLTRRPCSMLSEIVRCPGFGACTGPSSSALTHCYISGTATRRGAAGAAAVLAAAFWQSPPLYPPDCS